MYPIKRIAVKKLGSPHFTLIAKEHEKKPLKRGDLVKIEVVKKDAESPFVEVASDRKHDDVIATNDLNSVARALYNVNNQRKILIAAATKLKNGDKVLLSRGLATEEDLEEQKANDEALLEIQEEERAKKAAVAKAKTSAVTSSEFEDLSEAELEDLTDPNKGGEGDVGGDGNDGNEGNDGGDGNDGNEGNETLLDETTI